MSYTYQVTEVHLLKNSLRTVAARTALLDRVPSGATNAGWSEQDTTKCTEIISDDDTNSSANGFGD